MVLWLRPSRIRHVRCSPTSRHNVARGAYPVNGAGETLPVPSEEQRQVPTVTPWGACSRGRADPVRRGIAPKAAQPEYNRVD